MQSLSFRAAVLHATDTPLVVETVEAQMAARDDVLVRIKATGLCHTDLEVVGGQLKYPLPIVLGHEAAGVVEEVGPDVTGLAPGDHVILSWNPHCGRCAACDRGQAILCEEYLGQGPRGTLLDGRSRLSLDGLPLHHMFYLSSFAEFAIVSASSVIKVRDDMPFDAACLIGCGVMTGVGAATNIVRTRIGSTILVIGCGAVGLAAIQGARISGAGRIIAVDLNESKLALARVVGATDTLIGSVDVLDAIKEMTNGVGADVAIECAGTEKTLQLSVDAVRPGGDVVWLGKLAVDSPVTFRWGSLMGEKHITRSSYGGARPRKDFLSLTELYLDGRLQLDPLISSRISLDEINSGLNALKGSDNIRTVVEI